MICTMKPTVGGVAMRTACGRITLSMRWVRLSARPSAASHCGFGTDWIAAAPDLAEIGGDIEGERSAGGGERRDLEADCRQAEIAEEHDDEQRRALDQLHIGGAGEVAPT